MNEDDNRKTVLDWMGFALDMGIVAALTVLTVTRVSSMMLFVAIIGPMVGARLSALRGLRAGDGGPPAGGIGGSAIATMALALMMPFRRLVGG